MRNNLYINIATLSTCFPINKPAGSGFEIDKDDTTIKVPKPDIPEPKMKKFISYNTISLCF